MTKLIALLLCVAFLLLAGGFTRTGMALFALVVALLACYGVWALVALWFTPRPGR